MTRKFLGPFESEKEFCLVYYLGQWHISQNSRMARAPNDILELQAFRISSETSDRLLLVKRARTITFGDP